MPLYEFVCAECGHISEHVAPYAERETVRFDCPYEPDTFDPKEFPNGPVECGGTQSYAGLSPCAVGRAHTFGLVMADGRTVKGEMNGKDAPRRRRKA